MPPTSYLTSHSIATPSTRSNTYPPSNQRKDTKIQKKGNYRTSYSFPVGNPVDAYYEETTTLRLTLSTIIEIGEA